MSDFLGNPLETIFYLIVWVFVPISLLFVVRFASIAHKKTDDPRHRAATRSGFFAGIVMFFILLMYQVSGFLPYGFPSRSIYQGFDIWLAFSGALVNFLVLSGTRRLPPRWSSLAVLVITFLSLSIFVNYLFIRTQNQILLSLILGMTFGFLAYRAVSPNSLRDFLKS